MTYYTATETPAETFAITGATFIPKCTYCGNPMTSSEFDWEPGSTPGFYHAHSICRGPNTDGRYAVELHLGGGVHGSRCFHSLKRAEAEAQHLASWNANKPFSVLDMHEEVTLSTWVSEEYGADAKRV